MRSQRPMTRALAVALVAVVAMTILLPVAADARSRTGTRNTAIALTAASGYLFGRGHEGAGLLAAAGALAAWSNYNDRDRRDYRRYRYYGDRDKYRYRDNDRRYYYYRDRGKRYGHYKQDNWRHRR